MKINIILNEEEKSLDILYNNYNIIAKTIYNEKLTKKIVELITEELKQNDFNFTTLEEFLTMK